VLGLTVVVIDGEAQPPVGRTWKVKFDQHPRQAGAPIIAQGRVVGVTMPADNETADAITCIPLEQLRRFLGDDARGNPHVIASDVLLQLHVQRN
jgi:GAF domain-containing protein